MKFTVIGLDYNPVIMGSQDWCYQSYEARSEDGFLHAIHNTMPRAFNPDKPAPYVEFISRDVEAETGYSAIMKFLKWQSFGYPNSWLLDKSCPWLCVKGAEISCANVHSPDCPKEHDPDTCGAKIPTANDGQGEGVK